MSAGLTIRELCQLDPRVARAVGYAGYFAMVRVRGVMVVKARGDNRQIASLDRGAGR